MCEVETNIHYTNNYISPCKSLSKWLKTLVNIINLKYATYSVSQ